MDKIKRWDMDGMLEYSARTGDVIGAEVRPYEMGKGSYVLFADHEQVVADLNAARKHDHKLLELADQNIARLRAEADSLRKDAGRYRWLRDEAPEEWDITRWLDSETQEIHVQDYLDRAIDDAMGAKA